MSEDKEPATADPAGPEASDFEERDIGEAFVRMGELVDELQSHADPDVREKVFELLDWVDAFHREAVVRIFHIVPEEGLSALREDPVVAHLLETYVEAEEGEPEDLEGMLEEALEEIRPYVHSHGGEMEVVGVSNGVVTLRLMGSCHGCPASNQTLTQGVETILREKWPGFRGIEVEGEEEREEKPLYQIQSLKRK